MGNSKISGSLFAITPIIRRILIIAVVIALYYGIMQEGFFPLWQTYIGYGVKVIVAYEILAGSMRSLLSPALAGIIGFGMMIFCESYEYSSLFISTTIAWQLMIVALIGVFITISRL